jgi:hypothetical protein
MNDSAPSTAGTVGEVCRDLLDDQFGVESAKKESLETRGLAVITTSGTLVTLLLALASVITKTGGLTPSLGPRLLLLAALVAFVISATLGIYCNAPLHMKELDPGSLGGLTDEDVWMEPGYHAQRELSLAQLEILATQRGANEIKARVLLMAASVEVAAVLLTGMAAAVVLLQA